MPDLNSTPAVPTNTGVSSTLELEFTSEGQVVSGVFGSDTGITLYRAFGASPEGTPNGGTVQNIRLELTNFSPPIVSTTADGNLENFIDVFFSSGGIPFEVTSPENEIGTFTLISQTRNFFEPGDNLILTDDSVSEWITAGSGDDYILASAGFDIYEGGSGVDTLDYSQSDASVTLNFSAEDAFFEGSAFFATINTAIYSSGGIAEGQAIFGFESFIGSDFDDTFNALSVDFTFDGGDGNDLVNYASSDGAVQIDLVAGTTAGGDADGDTLLNIESITGSNFDDLLTGDASDNIFTGGDGNDTLIGGTGNDTLNGDAGIDILNGGSGADILNGGAQNDTLIGGGGNDTLLGGLGRDFLFGGQGDDLVLGGNRDDEIHGDAGNDRVFGGNGSDEVFGEDGNDILRGGTVDDTLDGGAGDDFVFGGTGIDTLLGGEGNDVIDGRGGFDTLNGGSGDDILTGGFNADTFVFEDGFGNDIITDFAATSNPERIDLSGVSEFTDFADLQANHLSQSGADTIIDDGAGNTITLTGVDIADLDAIDFIFAETDVLV